VNVFAIRHGETEWSLSGKHTGTTDIPLTEHGQLLAQRMRPVLATSFSGRALCSPMQRARQTCELAGFGQNMVVDPDLTEWNYGEYEGKTPEEIHKVRAGWLIFRDGCRWRNARAGWRKGRSGHRAHARPRLRYFAVRARTRAACAGCSLDWAARR
jgi:broad specificity phosphatase PhoE